MSLIPRPAPKAAGPDRPLPPCHRVAPPALATGLAASLRPIAPLLAAALLTTLLAAAPPLARPARAQTPEPSASPPPPRWTLHLPAVDRPAKELLLLPQARVGGAAMGIAAAGSVVFQAQGNSLLTWRRRPGGDAWDRVGSIDLLDPAPVDGAWLSVEGEVLSYLRQLRAPGPPDTPSSTPFLRLSLLIAETEGAATAGAGLDLPGRLVGQARAGDRLYLAVADPEGPGQQLLTLDVGRWETPLLLDRQALETTETVFLVALPETAQLLALGSDADAGQSRLWIWDTRSGLPRRAAPATLAFGVPAAALLRIPEGLLAVDGHGAGWVIPLRSKRLRLDRSRALSFDLGAITGPDLRQFRWVDAAASVANRVCFYNGIYVSTHSATMVANNLLACYDLPSGGQPGQRQVLALDRLVDAAEWRGGIHMAVIGDRVLLSRGSPGGFAELGPIGLDGAVVRDVDAPPGRAAGLLRRGNRLVTTEGDAQLRAWTIHDSSFDPWLCPAGLCPAGARPRLALPGAGRLITRDLPPSSAEQPDPELLLWREGGLGMTGQLQRVAWNPEAGFEAGPAEWLSEWLHGLRAAGGLLWSNQDGRIWRLGPEGRIPLDLPGRRGSLQDLAHLGRLRLLAAGADGLIVLDGADQVLGRLALPGPATAVAVDEGAGDGVAWVATGGLPALPPEPRQTAALYCLDLSDPTAPRVVAGIDVPGDRVDRLRAAGAGQQPQGEVLRQGVDNEDPAPVARVFGSGWQRRTAGGMAYDDALLFMVDARDCARPRLEGVTHPDRPPGFLAPPYQEPRLTWDLSPDGRQLYAAREGLEVYGLYVGP